MELYVKLYLIISSQIPYTILNLKEKEKKKEKKKKNLVIAWIK